MPCISQATARRREVGAGSTDTDFVPADLLPGAPGSDEEDEEDEEEDESLLLAEATAAGGGARHSNEVRRAVG